MAVRLFRNKTNPALQGWTYREIKTPGYKIQGCSIQGWIIRGHNIRGHITLVPSFLPSPIREGWGWKVRLAGSSLVHCPANKWAGAWDMGQPFQMTKQHLSLCPMLNFPKTVSMTCSVLICLACPALLSHFVPNCASSSILLHKFLQIFLFFLIWGLADMGDSWIRLSLSPTEEADRKLPRQNSIENLTKTIPYIESYQHLCDPTTL